MFAKELVQPPCSGALLLPAGRVGNCWSPLWPHQPAGNHGNHGNCSPRTCCRPVTHLNIPWVCWCYTSPFTYNLFVSYPTVLSSVNPNFGSYPRKSLVRHSNNEDLLTWRWAKHVNPFLPCVWIESYRVSAKNENRCPPFSILNSLSTLVTHLLSHKLYSKHVGMPMTNHFGKVK